MNYRTLLLLITLLCVQQLFAQSKLRFDRITVDDGLSHSTVHTILQNSDGQIWIGTEDGLNIFNGYDFKIFKHQSSIANSISNNVIKSIFKDSKGTIWIGTEKGLNRFIPEKNAFQAYFKIENDNRSLTSNHIRKIVEDKNGHIWVATNNGITEIIDYTENQLNCRQYPADIPNAPIGYGTVRGLFIDSKDQLWIGTDGGGVYKMTHILKSDEPKKRQIIHYQAGNDNFISSNRVNAFAEDKYGNLWMSTWNGGLSKLFLDENEMEQIIHFKHQPNETNSINLDKVTTLYVDSENYIWLGTYNMGVNRAKILPSTHELRFDSFVNDPDNIYSLSHNTAYSFFEANNGEVWIGTWGDGISKVCSQSNRMLSFSYENGFTNDVFHEIWSIDVDKNDNWWVSAWDGGIAKLSKKGIETLSYDKSIQYFRHEPNQPNSLSSDKITSILHDSQDRLWATTWGKFVNVASDISTTDKPDFKKIKVGDRTYFVFEDKKGTIWIGSQLGLYRLLGTESANFSADMVSMEIYKNFENNPNSLPSNAPRCMLEDSKGNIWIGTIDGGLAVAKRSTFDEFTNAQDMIFNIYQAQDTIKNSLSDNHILSIYEAKNGDIWIGTINGLDRFDTENQTFEHFNENTGHLKNNVVSGILEDEYGNLWVTTERGITELNLTQNTCRHFDEQDGLQDKNFSAGAVKQDKNGNLFFGGRNGFNVFNPNALEPNPFIPPIILTDFKIMNKSVTETHHSSIQNKTIQNIKKITVRHYENMLTFEFAALNYTIPEHNQYQYKLQGFDKDWIDIKHQRTATYTSLNPGKYTFLVKGSNNDGVWNEEPLKIKLKVLPPFWATWWFRILAFTIVIGTTFFLVRQRIKNAEYQNKILEQTVNERTEEIKKQKQLVEERSRFKEQFFSNVSHELRTPLNGIIGLSHLMERTKLSGVQSQFTNVIKDSAENLLVIVNDLLDISKINAGKLALQEKPFETTRFFNSLYELLRPRAVQKDIELDFILHHEMPLYLAGDSVRLYQVLINLLGNALKFTAEGSVNLVARPTHFDNRQLNLQLEIIDTGIGIPSEKLENIFNSYTQVIDQQGYHYEGTGLGLTIVKNLVDLQKGTIQVDSVLNRGTKFTVVLPFTIPTDEAIKISQKEKNKEDFSRKWKDKDVLLIEDNQVNLLYAKNLFVEWNLNVSIAKTMTEAIKLLSIAKYDVVITDVRLPDGNGIDLVRGLQKDNKHVNSNVPIIILSANASLSGARPPDIEVEAYISKPFKPERLAEVLSKIFKDSIGLPSGLADNLNPQNIKIQENQYLAHLYQLMKGNKKNMVAMLKIFLKQLPETIEALDTAIIQENWKTVNYHAHKIKSTIQTVGIFDLAQIANELEKNSEIEHPNLIQLLNLFEDFKQRSLDEIPRLKEEMNNMQQQLEIEEA